MTKANRFQSTIANRCTGADGDARGDQPEHCIPSNGLLGRKHERKNSGEAPEQRKERTGIEPRSRKDAHRRGPSNQANTKSKCRPVAHLLVTCEVSGIRKVPIDSELDSAFERFFRLPAKRGFCEAAVDRVPEVMTQS